MAVSRGSRVLALRGLHLLVLSSFAVSQPLYDVLGRTPEFFVVRGSTTLDIVVFALALLLLLPAVLLALEALAALASRRGADLLHLVFVGALVGVVALQVLKRADSLPAWVAVGLAAVVGAVGAAVYGLRPGSRLVLTVLAPAPLVFLALFLVNSPLERLELESAAHAKPSPPVRSETPVVVVVFDELPVASLMDGRGRIDARRYPSFASLAADSTWFRNATTVHEHTTEAIPSILTGKAPQHGRLPLVADHPENLFTFLGTSYGMHAYEPVTQLCPTDLCPRARDHFVGRISALGEDVSVVYLHAVLPEGLTRGLPSVSETWMDFGKEHAAVGTATEPLVLRNSADIDRTVGRELWADQRTPFERYVLSIERPREPTLYFLHSMLPHSPWRFLPSGRQYTESLGLDGIAEDTWGEDEWLVTQGWQRHLLQVGFTDRLLGRLLERLRATRIYDRALVVVVADHGVGFVPGERRRGVTPGNIGDVASVPLLVKRPGQTEPEIVDRHVRTTDIVPTVAEVLGTPLPYRADGRSLFDPKNEQDEVVVAERTGEAVSAPAAAVTRMRDETVGRMVATFGSGTWGRVFAIGPRADLLGRRVDGLAPRAEGVVGTVDNSALLANVDRESALSPAHVTGRLEGEGAEPGLDVAVAANGRVAAVTRSFGAEDDVKVSAFVPESAFREGANEVELFLVLGAGELVRVGGTQESAGYALLPDGRSVRTPGGDLVPVRPGALAGAVEDWFVERDTIRFGGWAGDLRAHRAATSVLVFADGELVYSGTPSVGRRDLAERYPGLGRSGFVVELRRDDVGEGGGVELRFFALRDGVASELAYPEGFPWTPRP